MRFILTSVNSPVYGCARTNVGLDQRIACPQARQELMKLVATSHVTQKKTTDSLDPLGSEQMVPLDPLGTLVMVPVAPVVEKLMVVETPNLGGEIGSADAPPEVLTQFLPMKRAPTPVIANKPVYSPTSFRPLYIRMKI